MDASRLARHGPRPYARRCMDAEGTLDRGASPFARSELEAALQAAEVGIWSWSVATGEVRWSPELLALYGVRPEDFEGSFEFFAGRIHPEDRERVVGDIARALDERREHFFVAHRIVRPGGEVRFSECHGRCLLDEQGQPTGMTGVSVDTTLRQLAETRLRDNEASLRLFSELASDYVYRVDLRDPAFTPVIVAGSLERVTGYTPEQVRALGGWLMLVHPEDRVRWPDILTTLRAGTPVVIQYRIIDRSGQPRWLRDRVRPIIEPGSSDVTALVGGIQDISEQKSLESQLLQAQKMEALARLSGGVAHDFNNLLTVIFSSVDMLRSGFGDAAQHLDDIEQASQRAAELTQSLLAFGQRQVGKPRCAPVHELVDGARGLLSRAVGERVKLILELEAELAHVYADPGNLQLVLLNLAVNARDAMPSGGELRIRTRKHGLGEAEARRPPELAPGPWISISVTDQGDGISAEVLPHIFEPFFTTKEHGRGTGLGLATVHGIVAQLGGTITVDTEPGRGSTFTIHLPATDPVERSEAVPEPRYSVGGTEQVLLVEDEPSLRRICGRVLRDLGYSVVEAESTEQALALGEDRLREFALLVSDVRLPGRSGLELATELLGLQPNTGVVLMSGHLGERAASEQLSSERYLFLSKPFTPAGLARRVRETLDRR